MHRRRFLGHLGGGLALQLLGPAVAVADQHIRIGLTPVFLDDQVSFLNGWRHYLEKQLGREIEFVQRGSYREIVDLVLQDKIQFAWLCGYPYVRNRSRIRLVAVPLYQGQPLYQSYVIVPSTDVSTQSLLDLRGKVFAYSDPDSNSGFLFPQFRLFSAGIRPESHFRRTFFTYGHRNVVEAVASRIADGGAVDGYVWDTLGLVRPDLVRRTRIVERSPLFGFPPMVASPGIAAATMKSMQAVLLGMNADPEGRGLLVRLNLERFEAASPFLFESIESMAKTVGGAS
jgi:phosphonate transport system substrate-binding protein